MAKSGNSVVDEMWGDGSKLRGEGRSIFKEAFDEGDFQLHLLQGMQSEFIVRQLGSTFLEALRCNAPDVECRKYLVWLLDYICDLERSLENDDGGFNLYRKITRDRCAKIMELLGTQETVSKLADRPATCQTALVYLARQWNQTFDNEEADRIFAWFMQWSRVLERKGTVLRDVLKCALNQYFPLKRLEWCLLDLRHTMHSDGFSFTLFDCMASGLGKTLCHINELPFLLPLLIDMNQFSNRAFQALEESVRVVAETEAIAKALEEVMEGLDAKEDLHKIRFKTGSLIELEAVVKLDHDDPYDEDCFNDLYNQFAPGLSACMKRFPGSSLARTLSFVVERIESRPLYKEGDSIVYSSARRIV